MTQRSRRPISVSTPAALVLAGLLACNQSSDGNRIPVGGSGGTAGGSAGAAGTAAGNNGGAGGTPSGGMTGGSAGAGSGGVKGGASAGSAGGAGNGGNGGLPAGAAGTNPAAGSGGTATGGFTATGGTASGGTAAGGTATGGTGGASGAAAPLKPRIVIMTDIGPDSVEPDDAESLIRLFVHADLYEIEGIFAGSGWNSSDYPPAWADRINTTIDAYEKDLPNLRKRSNQSGHLSDESRQEIGYWPSPAYLRSRAMLGSKKMGTSILGENNDSAGSKELIKLVDENDDRPIWVGVGGGANTLSQALWRVQKERTAEQLKTFLHKIRLYTITDQDKPWGSDVSFTISSHQWMRKQFGSDLMFLWDECAWLYQNATGVSHWSDYATNIQGHGNLGAIYPKYRWGVEGDTPDFLHLMPSGLNDPNLPGQAGWGGFFAWGQSADGVTSAYVNQSGTAANTTCNKYEAYFYPATFNNFAARMDWAKDGAGNRNPVVTINDKPGVDVITLKPAAGTSVTLDASASSDPDGDKLTFKWWMMAESGTYAPSITIANAASKSITLAVPADAAGKTIHVICEVTDSGTPNLTSYRRIVIESQ